MAQDTFTSSDYVGDVLVTKIQGDLTELFAIATEVTNARDGEATLLAQINALQALISTVTTEVTNARDGEATLLAQIDSLQGFATEVVNARDGEATLLAQINAIQALIASITTEITNARDGEATLLAQIDSLQSSIASLVSGSGVIISSNDSTVGYLNGKLVAGEYISLTEGNDGGNETLTIATDFPTTETNKVLTGTPTGVAWEKPVRTWSSMTGAVSAPLTVYHSAKYWGLVSTLADVTASEPGVTSDWVELTTGAGYEEITTSQNWTPNPESTWALVYCIGAGSGGVYNTASPICGGAGGEGVFKLFRIADLSTPVSVTIGAGGVAGTDASKSGAAGGNTTFGAYLTAYGGGYVAALVDGYRTSSRKSDTINASDYPNLLDWYVGFHEGLGGANGKIGGDSIYGGAGGGSAASSKAGGSSEFAGDGGDGAVDANATDGTAPGGGGGGCYDSGGGDDYTAGDGADGACRIWQW